eukprot:COSAG01_NODE_18350_length_1082_cov_1.573754_1_plen_250_part_00
MWDYTIPTGGFNFNVEAHRVANTTTRHPAAVNERYRHQQLDTPRATRGGMATIAGQTPEALTSAVARVVAEAEDEDALTLRKLRQGVEKMLGVDLSSDKSSKAAVKPIIEAAFAAVIAGQEKSAVDDAVSSPPPRDSVGVFTQPTAPPVEAAAASPDGAIATQQNPSSNEVVPLADEDAVFYTCVRKVTIRQGAAVSSAKVGSLAVGEKVAVLETRELQEQQPQQGKATTTTRVRCERGWASVQSSSGA